MQDRFLASKKKNFSPEKFFLATQIGLATNNEHLSLENHFFFFNLENKTAFVITHPFFEERKRTPILRCKNNWIKCPQFDVFVGTI
jgi:hypothetical protein